MYDFCKRCHRDHEIRTYMCITEYVILVLCLTPYATKLFGGRLDIFGSLESLKGILFTTLQWCFCKSWTCFANFYEKNFPSLITAVGYLVVCHSHWCQSSLEYIWFGPNLSWLQLRIPDFYPCIDSAVIALNHGSNSHQNVTFMCFWHLFATISVHENKIVPIDP